MRDEIIISKLKDIIGNYNVLIDRDSKNKYGKDLTQRYFPNPLAIVFPLKEKDVLDIVNLSNEHHLKLVPSGGRTGYSGGAVAINEEIIVSFEKMNKILSFNDKNKTVQCEPGLITKELQDFAKENNLFYPVDFASSGSSQIGGNIATNAGGIKVIRYGLTRNWVVGLRVVTGNGDILELNHGLIKNAAGYDLLHLFIGSEGTLGFITEATMKLTELPLSSKVILLSVNDNSHFIDILNVFRKIKYVTAFEFFSDKALKHVLEDSSLISPFPIKTPFYILLEYDSDKENDNSALQYSQCCLDEGWVSDVIISDSIDQEKKLWQLRERISMSLLKYSPYKYDISVLPSKVSKFMMEIDILFKENYPAFEIIWFGHVGDGNLHLNVLKPELMTSENFLHACDKLSELVYKLIEDYQGSISAEHGIGLLKKGFLHYSKSENEINYMKCIKKVFDTNNIMNPLKVF